MDPALDADLGRADRPGLRRPAAHLVQRQRVGVGVPTALRERAEPASGVADISEVDVAVDDVGDVLAHDVAAQSVRERAELLQGGAVRAEQGQRLVVGDPGRIGPGVAQGGEHVGADPPHGTGTSNRAGPARDGPAARADDSVDPRPGRADLGTKRLPVTVDRAEVRPFLAAAPDRVDRGVQIGAAGVSESAVGLLPGAAGREHTVGEQAVRAGQRPDVPGQARVDPWFTEMGGVDGEPGPQREPGLRRHGTQDVQVRPGPLGVDVVGGDRGDAAPVVDAGRKQQGALRGVNEVRRSLHPHRGAQHQPGDRDGRGQLLGTDVGRGAHRGVVLGAEILDDHLLDRPVAAGQTSKLEDRLGPLRPGLPDAEQQAGRERDRQPPGVGEDPQADGRVLVG